MHPVHLHPLLSTLLFYLPLANAPCSVASRSALSLACTFYPLLLASFASLTHHFPVWTSEHIAAWQLLTQLKTNILALRTSQHESSRCLAWRYAMVVVCTHTNRDMTTQAASARRLCDRFALTDVAAAHAWMKVMELRREGEELLRALIETMRAPLTIASTANMSVVLHALAHIATTRATAYLGRVAPALTDIQSRPPNKPSLHPIHAHRFQHTLKLVMLSILRERACAAWWDSISSALVQMGHREEVSATRKALEAADRV